MRSRDPDHPGQHGETPSLLKIQKISWAWWHMPVIPATEEAEAGELPELRRRRLQRAEIAPLHYNLGNERNVSKQTNKKTSFMPIIVFNSRDRKEEGKKITNKQPTKISFKSVKCYANTEE